jgi:hypothetical protein
MYFWLFESLYQNPCLPSCHKLLVALPFWAGGPVAWLPSHRPSSGWSSPASPLQSQASGSVCSGKAVGSMVLIQHPLKAAGEETVSQSSGCQACFFPWVKYFSGYYLPNEKKKKKTICHNSTWERKMRSNLSRQNCHCVLSLQRPVVPTSSCFSPPLCLGITS